MLMMSSSYHTNIYIKEVVNMWNVGDVDDVTRRKQLAPAEFGRLLSIWTIKITISECRA